VEETRAAMEGLAAGGATVRERALVAYARALTERPGAMREEDLRPLRAAGLDDTEISDLAQVVAYFNYINRIADGLGVDLEPFMPPHRTEGGSTPARP
jgi:uncharacterized peroxidase-related enzyme